MVLALAGQVWSWVTSKVVLIAGAVLAIALFLREVKKAGRNEVRVEQHERAQQSNAQSAAIRANADAMSGDDARRMLAEKWSSR